MNTFFLSGESGQVIPGKMALSLWGPNSLNGPAVCGLAAFAAERDYGRDGWLPARFTIELFKAAKNVPTSTKSEILREGGRIRVVRVSILQEEDGREVLVAQANTVFMKQATNPPGQRWSRPEETYSVPDTADDDFHTHFWDTEQGWGSDMTKYQSNSRLRLWSRPISVVEGIEPTPFQRAVIAAESTSLATNWGEGGIGFINADLTVALSRLPVGERVGVDADVHVEADGVSAGSAVLFDADGAYGVGLVTALDNSRAMIDFTRVLPAELFGGDGPFTPDGRRAGDDHNV